MKRRHLWNKDVTVEEVADYCSFLDANNMPSFISYTWHTLHEIFNEEDK